MALHTRERSERVSPLRAAKPRGAAFFLNVLCREWFGGFAAEPEREKAR